jgi:hypothetical protein
MVLKKSLFENGLGYRRWVFQQTGELLSAAPVLRYADAGARSMGISVPCYAHAPQRIARDRAVALKVYDDRNAS